MVCPHCRADNDELDDRCIACDKPLDVLPVRRQGNRFVVYRGSALPPYCVKCGDPARAEPLKAKFYWHEPALYLLIFCGLLIYVIVAMIVRKRFELGVPLCEAHFQRRRTMRWTALGLFVGGFVVVFAGLASKSDTVQGLGCVGAVLATTASVILYAITERTLRPTQITDTTGEFAGAGEAFLSRLN